MKDKEILCNKYTKHPILPIKKSKIKGGIDPHLIFDL